MTKPAGRVRRAIHTRILQFDEFLCRRFLSLPVYELTPSDVDAKMREFLALCALGQLSLIYENGLGVPRSLFYSRFAVVLLSSRPGARRMIRTPYGYGSGLEILGSKLRPTRRRRQGHHLSRGKPTETSLTAAATRQARRVRFIRSLAALPQ